MHKLSKFNNKPIQELNVFYAKIFGGLHCVSLLIIFP